MIVKDLKLLFEKINQDDFIISNKELSNKSSLVYGEVDYNDIGNIILSLKINYDNILDIGSGCGKIVIYLAIILNSYIDGVEIDTNRFNKSELLLNTYNLHEKISFINDSFENVYFGNYDIIYCCNLVFDTEDNDKLYNKINKEFSGTFILFEFNNILLPYLKLTKFVKTSWSKQVKIFIFNK